MKCFKKLFICLTAFVFFVMAGLIILSATLKPEWVKEYVSQHLETATDEPVHISGSVSWKFFPHPGIKISGIKVGDDLKKSAFNLKIEQLFLNFEILPLLHGKFVFSEISVDGFDVVLHEKNVTQTRNLIPKKSSDPELDIEKFSVTHGHIYSDNGGGGQEWSDFQLEAEQMNLQSRVFPFQFKSKITFQDKDKILFKSWAQFKGSTSLSARHFHEPEEGLKNLFLSGQMILKNIQFNLIKIDKISTNVVLKNKILKLNPITLDLYQGNSIGDLIYNFQTKKLKINQTVNNLNGGQLTKDLFQQIIVNGEMDFAVHTDLDLQVKNWQDSISGEGNFSMKDGSIESINLSKIVSVIREKVQQLMTSKLDIKSVFDSVSFNSDEFFKGGTPFKILNIQYRLNHQILSAESFFLQAEDLQVKGNGQYNINDLSLRASVQIAWKGLPADSYFPFIIKGTLFRPIVYPDLKAINPLLTGWIIKDQFLKLLH